MMILINYKFICKIVHHNTLNIISMDRANRRLINTSVYLSIYQLNIHHILDRLNFVFNAFSRFYVLGNDIVYEDDIESVLNVL